MGLSTLPFAQGLYGGAGQGRKAVMTGEVQKLGIEDRLAHRVAAGHDVLEVVVEALGRNPLQIPEGPDVTVHKALQGAALEELDIGGPAVAQHQHEGKDRAEPARGLHDLEVGPVELGLAARLRLEPHVGQAALLLFDGVNVVLHSVVAAGIALVLQACMDPARPIVILLQVIPDGLVVRRQNRFPAPGLAVPGELVAGQMLLDGVAVKTQPAGNRPDSHSLAVQGLDVPVTLLGDHGVSPPLWEETIPRSHPQGGTLFIPVSGTLLHAHRHPDVNNSV